MAARQGGLQGLVGTGAVLRGQAQSVLDHRQSAVRPRLHPHIALLGEHLAHRLGPQGLGHRHGEGHQHPRGRLAVPRELGPDALGRVAPDLAPAAAAEQPRRPRHEQLQVVAELGHGADGGARGAHRVGLVDGDGRRDALDALGRRAVHAVEELAGVGGEGLHIAPLALGIDGVEGQGRLAGAGHPRDHDQPAQGQVEIDVLQVVLAHAAQADVVVIGWGLGHGRARGLGSASVVIPNSCQFSVDSCQ